MQSLMVWTTNISGTSTKLFGLNKELAQKFSAIVGQTIKGKSMLIQILYNNFL